MRRAIIFFGVCLPVRLALATCALYLTSRLFGILPILISIGFFYKWSRRFPNETGIFGGPAYWAEVRLLHSYLWLAGGISILVQEYRLAGGILYLDIFIGLIISLAHTYL